MEEQKFDSIQDQQLYDQLQQEKKNFISSIKMIQDKIYFHVNEFHKDQNECTNILNFLDSNLECMCEDMAEWTKNDRDSWMIVINPDGTCEDAQPYVDEIKELLMSTAEWDTKYEKFVDPISNSLQRVQKYQEEENTLQKNNQKKGMMNDNFFAENENQIIGQNHQNENIPEDQVQEMNALLQEKLELKKVLLDVGQQICQHINNHQECQSKQLLNQIKQLDKDLTYWTKVDRQSWEVTLKVLRLDSCKDAAQYKERVMEEVIKKTIEWEKRYDSMLSIKQNDYDKFLNNLKDIEGMQKNVQSNVQNEQSISKLFQNLDLMEKDLMVAVNDLIKLHDAKQLQ